MNAPERHLRLLTETTAAVNSTLDLEEVLHLVAEKVADALAADRCCVCPYYHRDDEHGVAEEQSHKSSDRTRDRAPHPLRHYDPDDV